MNNKYSISVLMSVYNSETTIEKSITSIINQSYKNFEFLIMDDFSNDNTFSICKNLEDNYEKIKVYRNDTNLGLTKSLNKLIRLSEGQFIARQDADDFSHKKRFEMQLNYISKKNLDGCTTRARVIQTNKLIPGLSFYLPQSLLLKFKNPFIHGSLLIKKKSLLTVNCYDEKFYYAQDYKLMSDLLKAKSKISILNQPLYDLNMNNNISTNFYDKQKYYADCVRKNTTPTEVR